MTVSKVCLLSTSCWQLELSWRGESAVNADRVAKVAHELELPYTVNSGEYAYGENMLNAGKAGSTYALSLIHISM